MSEASSALGRPLALVILTAVIGTSLFRAQGFRVLMRAQDVLAQGGFPAKELFDGICILFGRCLIADTRFRDRRTRPVVAGPGLTDMDRSRFMAAGGAIGPF